ncbi:MAG TPA: hypothetical protein VF141_18440 [Chryseolinea sp.]
MKIRLKATSVAQASENSAHTITFVISVLDLYHRHDVNSQPIGHDFSGGDDDGTTGCRGDVSPF